MRARWDLGLGWLMVVAASCGNAASPPAPAVRADIPLPSDMNGALWDASANALYLTDTARGQLVRWTDHDGFSTVATWAPSTPGGKLALGGLVADGSGGFITTSFGFGSDGALLTWSGGTAARVEHLDPTRRRIGIARAPDGMIYDAYFVLDDGDPAGGIARVGSGGEVSMPVAELHKPVGIAASADAVYVADQLRSRIAVYQRAPDGSLVSPSVLAPSVPAVDLLTLLPNGDLVTGGKLGGVYRIHAADKSGRVDTLADGLGEVRGVAFDPAGKRLFVVEHGRDDDHRKLHIVPYDPDAK